MKADLYLGDYQDKLPGMSSDSVSVVITDPPFLNLKGARIKGAEFSNAAPVQNSSTRIIDPWNASLAWAADAWRIAQHGVMVFCSHHNLVETRQAFPDASTVGLLSWYRRNAPPTGKNVPRYNVQFIWLLKKAVGLKWDEFDTMLIDIPMLQAGCFATERILQPGTKKALHPCQKPIQLMQRLLISGCDSVLDPFMGTGTTGVACARTGCDFIGIEIDPEYFEIAKARIAKAQAEMVQASFLEEHAMETPATYTTEDAPDQIEDASNDHAYFCMMPNMLDDLLDPYQYRLYAHIKRVCGEKGRCWQSTETIAKACKMSTGKVSEAKRQLAEMGLIAITEKPRKNGGWPYHHIKIVDIWNRNIIHCSPKPSSPDEQASSPDETKKTPCFKKTPEQGATAPPPPADDSWPTEPAEHEPETPRERPEQERLERMRATFGDDPLSVGAHCQEAQEREGQWTVPEHGGLSPACAVFKEATGYAPPGPWRDEIVYNVGTEPDNLKRWYDTCFAYVGCGWNPRNVKAMLDYYVVGEIPETKGRKANGGSSTPRTLPNGFRTMPTAAR